MDVRFLMTALTNADEPPDTDRTGPSSHPRWEFPEIAVVVVLAAVGVLALGGLATGIARSFQGNAISPPGFDRQYVGSSIQFGALWANVVLAAVLLGLMGVCWWNLGEWEPEPDEARSEDGAAEAEGHINRGRNIVIAVQVALGLTSMAAIASLVGAIIGYHSGIVYWAPDFNAGANAVAVLAMAITGVVVGRGLTNRYAADVA